MSEFDTQLATLTVANASLQTSIGKMNNLMIASDTTDVTIEGQVKPSIAKQVKAKTDPTVNALNSLMTGTASQDVVIGGVTKPTISKDLATRFAATKSELQTSMDAYARDAIGDGQLRIPGLFFYGLQAEKAAGGYLYLKLLDYNGTGNVVYARNGFLPNLQYTLGKIVADLAIAPSAAVVTNATSPKGKTGCIRFAEATAMWLDTNTGTFSAGARTSKPKHYMLVNWDYDGLLRDCEAIEDIRSALETDAYIAPLVTYTKAEIDDPLRQCSGYYFNSPYYEWNIPSATGASGALYFKPIGFGDPETGNAFYARGGFYPDTQHPKAKILADLDAAPSALIVTNATSPSGVTGCIKVDHGGCIWFNPTTGVFSGATRNRRPGWIKMIENNYGHAGNCEERAVIIQALIRQLVAITSPSPYFPLQSSVRGFEIVAHRGGWAFGAPENSTDAVRHAGKAGYKWIENDTRITSDGVFVVLHDESLNRTYQNVDGTEISGTVNIADITYAQAQAYVQKSPIPKYRRTMPTLEDWLMAVKLSGAKPFFELKPGVFNSTHDDAVIALVRKYFSDSDVVLISFDSATLARFATKTGWKFGLLDGSISQAAAIPRCFRAANDGDIDDAYAAACAAAGVELSCWTVNSQNSLNRMLKIGVHYIISDYVAPNSPGSLLTVAMSSMSYNPSSLTMSNGLSIVNGSISMPVGSTVASANCPSAKFIAMYGELMFAGSLRVTLWVGGGIFEQFDVTHAKMLPLAISRISGSQMATFKMQVEALESTTLDAFSFGSGRLLDE